MKVDDFKGEVGQHNYSRGYFFQDLSPWQSKYAHAWRVGQNYFFVKFIEN